MKREITSAAVKEYGRSAGANLVGIASAREFTSAPEGFKPADVLPGCLSVIVLGAAFSPEVLHDIDEYTASRNAILFYKECESRVGRKDVGQGLCSCRVSQRTP